MPGEQDPTRPVDGRTRTRADPDGARRRPSELTADLLLDARAELAEGPRWDPRTRQVLWVDIPAGRVATLDPVTGATTGRDLGRSVGAVAPRAGGGLVAAVAEGFALLDPDGTETVVPVGHDTAVMRMNDGVVDPAGRFLAGSLHLAEEPGTGVLHRLDPDGRVSTLLTGATVSNGLGWSPDGRTLYYADSPTGRVDRIVYDPATGALGARTPWVHLAPEEGVPDGLVVDAEGAVWIALWGGGQVRRYAPDAALLTVVHVPASRVTAVAFVGEHLDRLVITTARQGLDDAALSAQPLAGGLFTARPGPVGLAPTAFAG